MKKIMQLFFVFTAFLLSNAFASTITEGTDFPGYSSFGSSATSVGVLDFGINTISGSLAGDCVVGNCNRASAGDSQDSFLLEIASGFKIDSLFVTTSNVNGPADFSVSFGLRDPSSTLVSDPFLPINSITGDLLTTIINSGIYSISMFGQQASEAGSYTLDYSIEVNVSSVPVPAAVWLFGSSLIGFVGLRKKASKSSTLSA